jgi:hypothetical protein
MKRIKSNYYTLHLLKTAQPKLRKAIISNCIRELLNRIMECVLNLLNGNLKVSNCARRMLQKHKGILRKVFDKRVSYSATNRLIKQRGRILLPLMSAVLPIVANLLFRQRAK